MGADAIRNLARAGALIATELEQLQNEDARRQGCVVCQRQTHAKWHEVARGDINPVALIQFVESLQCGDGVVEAVVGWIGLVTGMDMAAMRAMVAADSLRSSAGR